MDFVYIDILKSGKGVINIKTLIVLIELVIFGIIVCHILFKAYRGLRSLFQRVGGMLRIGKGVVKKDSLKKEVLHSESDTVYLEPFWSYMYRKYKVTPLSFINQNDELSEKLILFELEWKEANNIPIDPLAEYSDEKDISRGIFPIPEEIEEIQL